MRRGGIVILLIGVIIALAAAGLLFLFLQTSNQAQEPTPIPTEDPGRDIVVARVDIPASTLLNDTATLLEIQNIPTDEFNQQYFTNISDVQGKLTISDLRAGQRIEKPAVTEPGLSQQIPTAEPDRPRPKAYAFATSSLRGVADQIKPGDFVDVVATFLMPRRISYPTGLSFDEQGQGTIERELSIVEFRSTKTIVQQVQVLRIVRPGIPAEEGQPAPQQPSGNEAPQTDESGQPVDASETSPAGTITEGEWLLVLAINDQEAELVEFALNTDADISLVLRGAGDTDFEPTIGATFDLLVSEFGVPAPRPVEPRIYGLEVLTPEPILTPAPTRIP